MQPLTRWWLRRRHADSEWAPLLQPAPADAWVSLDLETTGMNPGQDHILSLAAVPVHDAAPDSKPGLSSRLPPAQVVLVPSS